MKKQKLSHKLSSEFGKSLVRYKDDSEVTNLLSKAFTRYRTILLESQEKSTTLSSLDKEALSIVGLFVFDKIKGKNREYLFEYFRLFCNFMEIIYLLKESYLKLSEHSPFIYQFLNKNEFEYKDNFLIWFNCFTGLEDNFQSKLVLDKEVYLFWQPYLYFIEKNQSRSQFQRPDDQTLKIMDNSYGVRDRLAIEAVKRYRKEIRTGKYSLTQACRDVAGQYVDSEGKPVTTPHYLRQRIYALDLSNDESIRDNLPT